nr:N-succinylarginine dihydrolase [Klebsiella pneumoniae]
MHLTVANLQDKFHRASEAPTTEALLQAIFPDRTRFAIHPALPASAWFGDEGRRTIIVSAASMALPASSSLSMAAAGERGGAASLSGAANP